MRILIGRNRVRVSDIRIRTSLPTLPDISSRRGNSTNASNKAVRTIELSSLGEGKTTKIHIPDIKITPTLPAKVNIGDVLPERRDNAKGIYRAGIKAVKKVRVGVLDSGKQALRISVCKLPYFRKEIAGVFGKSDFQFDERSSRGNRSEFGSREMLAKIEGEVKRLTRFEKVLTRLERRLR